MTCTFSTPGTYPIIRSSYASSASCPDSFFPNGLTVSNRTSNATFRIDPSDYIGHAIIGNGGYETLSLRLARQLMEKGGLFLDVGANFGLFTFHVGNLRNVQVIAVEPGAKNFCRLQKNRLLNPAARVALVNAGLSDREEIVRFENPLAGNSGTFRVAVDSSVAESLKYLICLTTLEKLLAEMKAGSVELMKIDVEGFEMEVFKGFDWEGGCQPANVIMEFTDYVYRSDSTTDECFDFFLEKGYSPYTVLGEPYAKGDALPESNIWWKIN